MSRKTKPQKFRTAEHAARYRANQKSWLELVKKYEPIKKTIKLDKMEKLSHRGYGKVIPSAPISMDPCTKSEIQKYTGTNMLGIATLHKSNSIPVFRQEDAIDIAKMRR